MDNLQLHDAELGVGIVCRDDLAERVVMHRHAFLEMIYIFTGKGIHELEDGNYEISPGDLLIVPPGAAHAYRDRCRMSLVNIMFDLEKLMNKEPSLQKSAVFRALFLSSPELTGKFRFRNRLSLFDRDRDECERIIHEMVFEERTRKTCWEARLYSLLVSLVVQIVRLSESSRYRGPENLILLDAVIAYMRDRIRSDVSLPKVAEKFGLSQRNLERLFQEAVQCTPLAYWNGLRLKTAERLLMETGKSIGEIAEAAGFPDSNYFAKAFRRKHLISPRDFREKARRSMRKAYPRPDALPSVPPLEES